MACLSRHSELTLSQTEPGSTKYWFFDALLHDPPDDLEEPYWEQPYSCGTVFAVQASRIYEWLNRNVPCCDEPSRQPCSWVSCFFRGIFAVRGSHASSWSRFIGLFYSLGLVVSSGMKSKWPAVAFTEAGGKIRCLISIQQANVQAQLEVTGRIFNTELNCCKVVRLWSSSAWVLEERQLKRTHI